MQTGTNIPLSPNTYDDYVGIMYDDIKNPPNNELKDGRMYLRYAKWGTRMRSVYKGANIS